MKKYIVFDNCGGDFVSDLRDEPVSKNDIQERFGDLYNGCRDEEYTDPKELDFDFIQSNWEVTIYELKKVS